MKIRSFPDTGTLTIELPDRVSSSSEAISDNLIVDFDERGKPVGVTPERYSQISDASTTLTLLLIAPDLQPAWLFDARAVAARVGGGRRRGVGRLQGVAWCPPQAVGRMRGNHRLRRSG